MDPTLRFCTRRYPATSKGLSLKRLLRSGGLEARTFGSGLEFLDSQRPDLPGCLILDVRLPGLSGLDLQTELAARTITLPIIFVTGHGASRCQFGQVMQKMEATSLADLIHMAGKLGLPSN